ERSSVGRFVGASAVRPFSFIIWIHGLESSESIGASDWLDVGERVIVRVECDQLADSLFQRMAAFESEGSGVLEGDVEVARVLVLAWRIDDLAGPLRLDSLRDVPFGEVHLFRADVEDSALRRFGIYDVDVGADSVLDVHESALGVRGVEDQN